LIGLALVVSAIATLDARRTIGQSYPGFGVLELLYVAPGGVTKGGLAPFDHIHAVNGRPVTSGHELQAEVRRHPPGTPISYLVIRRGQLVELTVPSVALTVDNFFHRYLLDGLLPSLLYLSLAMVVLALRPGARETRVFVFFCLTWFCTAGLFVDSWLTYRFSALFLTAWAFAPAAYLHIAVRFPHTRSVARRWPWIIPGFYVLSGLFAAATQFPVGRIGMVIPALTAGYWAASLLVLTLALGRAAVKAESPLMRQRAKVLAAGFVGGPLLPVIGTAAEVMTGVAVPYLEQLWRLNFLFPLAVAYAMIRYDLFDVRSLIRASTVYAVVTGLVVAAYAGAIVVVDLVLSSLGMGSSRLLPAAVVALAVVLFLNPVYQRTQRLVDRLFFRGRFDVQQTIERVADSMTTLLDLNRIVLVISETVETLLRPQGHVLLILDEAAGAFRPMGADRAAFLAVPADSALARILALWPIPLTRERLAEAPDLRSFRDEGLAALESLGAALVVPVVFRARVTGLLCLGPRPFGVPYTTEDLRLTRLLVNQSAVALENAKAFTALEQAHQELQSALRRVQILESIRANLNKFVPRTVQDLIEQAPEAPLLEKREVDVTVLFVDIAGYTRLSERFDLARVNELVERYFGAFLDEILRHGGDVSETAGDGLMVIFHGEDGRAHARAAVLAAQGMLRRAHAINLELADLTEPIRLHVGVNSGTAGLGATKIEGTAGTRWTYTASGPVTNVAARLAALADGDSVVVGSETARRLEGVLAMQDWGERRLKNVEEPVRVYAIAVAVPAAG
jgi:class 3 adenylate cyclase